MHILLHNYTLDIDILYNMNTRFIYNSKFFNVDVSRNKLAVKIRQNSHKKLAQRISWWFVQMVD